MKRREEVNSLSQPPSIDISIYPNDTTGIQDVIIENTGQHKIKNIEVYPIFYILQKDPPQINRRSFIGKGIEVKESLSPKEKVVEPSSRFTFIASPKNPPEPNTEYAFALVVVFRREVDNKRYVEIEPFFIAEIVGDKVLFPLYTGKLTTGVSSQMELNILKEIIETEKFYFRANQL